MPRRDRSPRIRAADHGEKALCSCCTFFGVLLLIIGTMLALFWGIYMLGHQHHLSMDARLFKPNIVFNEFRCAVEESVSRSYVMNEHWSNSCVPFGKHAMKCQVIRVPMSCIDVHTATFTVEDFEEQDEEYLKETEHVVRCESCTCDDGQAPPASNSSTAPCWWVAKEQRFEDSAIYDEDQCDFDDESPCFLFEDPARDYHDHRKEIKKDMRKITEVCGIPSLAFVCLGLFLLLYQTATRSCSRPDETNIIPI